MTSGPPYLHRHEGEKYFIDPLMKKDENKVKVPSIQDEGSIDLSVIVPSYNEEDRCKSKKSVNIQSVKTSALHNGILIAIILCF